MVKVKKEDLQKLKVLTSDDKHHNNNGVLYINGDVIYKTTDTKYFFPDELNRNIEYQINNPIPNTPSILDKLYIDDEYSGYVMENIKNSISFRDAIKKRLPLDKKIKAIQDIHQALKYLHSQNITLGDIHMDNFLITEDGGYLIDLDYMRFPGDEFKFQTCYDLIVNKHKITKSSKYGDSLKVMIVSLSLLLDIDLEELLIDKNNLSINELLEVVRIIDEKLASIIEKMISTEEVTYFDDYLQEYYKKLSGNTK